MTSEISGELNTAWKKTCKVIFGEEVGDLREYSKWLKEITDQNEYKKSSISGKEVAFAIKEYDKNAKTISFDEIDFGRKFEPLSIDKIKDIDSIIEQIQDRVYYCGNILLGNCKNVEQSSNITDGFLVYDCAHFFNVKYMAYSTVGRENSYCFGTHCPGGSEFLIRCCQTVVAKRSFESYLATNTSDSYYSYGLEDCTNCLFSFNLKNKKNCIGNLELPKDKFESIKKNLLSEIARELKKKKSAPSLLDIIRKSRPVDKAKHIDQSANEEKQNKEIIEKEFSLTSRLIFGKQLVGMDNYGGWLIQNLHKVEEAKSAISNKKILWLPYGVSLVPLPEQRIVTMEEAEELSKLSISSAEAQSITLKNAHECIGKIAYLKVDVRYGQNTNLIDCTYCIDCSNCYNVAVSPRSKYCAFSVWPKDSQNCFGVYSLMNSSFCFNCHNSAKLTRCFEMDNCRDCSDSMFCHNCEGLTNCMFCFNTKSKRYAIGNVEVGKEKYEAIRKMVLDEISKKLEEEKRFDHSIYNLGTGGK
ncbi:hypothetical protein HY988_05745 [Candidatus Micrarchaeota archaeon]|nr:hypothetical protein [Candidatus Micrarchaeota archaeon]